MAISIKQLRVDLYNIIDKVIATGIPIEIKHKGHIVKIMPKNVKSKLQHLTKHPGTIVGDPEKLVHINW